MKGIIVKGIAGFYYVKLEDGTVIQCKARGVFKKKGITPSVGDRVEITINQDGDGVVEKIFERENEFSRPPVSNVDVFLIVLAAKNPDPSLGLIDRFTAMAEMHHTDVIIVINKSDLATEEELRAIEENYEGIYPVVRAAAKSGKGIAEIEELCKGRTAALAGPSGVGKSTILNMLQGEGTMETGTVSEKTGRGRHTTRHAELFDMPGGGMIFDTPGFTSFEVTDSDEEELCYLFPDIAKFAGECRFDNCRHLKEPGCKVLDALEAGEIKESRYNSYKNQLLEIQEKERNKY